MVQAPMGSEFVPQEYYQLGLVRWKLGLFGWGSHWWDQMLVCFVQAQAWAWAQVWMLVVHYFGCFVWPHQLSQLNLPNSINCFVCSDSLDYSGQSGLFGSAGSRWWKFGSDSLWQSSLVCLDYQQLHSQQERQEEKEEKAGQMVQEGQEEKERGCFEIGSVSMPLLHFIQSAEKMKERKSQPLMVIGSYYFLQVQQVYSWYQSWQSHPGYSQRYTPLPAHYLLPGKSISHRNYPHLLLPKNCSPG